MCESVAPIAYKGLNVKWNASRTYIDAYRPRKSSSNDASRLLKCDAKRAFLSPIFNASDMLHRKLIHARAVLSTLISDCETTHRILCIARNTKYHLGRDKFNKLCSNFICVIYIRICFLLN